MKPKSKANVAAEMNQEYFGLNREFSDIWSCMQGCDGRAFEGVIGECCIGK